MRVQQFYVHRALLACILEESGRAQKRNDLLQVLKREREYLQENQQQQNMFEQRFSRLCNQSSGVPRWFRFSSHPSIVLDTMTGMIWPTVPIEKWTMHKQMNGLDGWRLPFKEEVCVLLEDQTFPLLDEKSHGICGQDRVPISSSKAVRVEQPFPSLVAREKAKPFCTSSIFLIEQEWPIQEWKDLIPFFVRHKLIPEEGTFGQALIFLYGERNNLFEQQRASEDRLLIGKEQLEILEHELNETIAHPKNLEDYRFEDAELESLKLFFIEKDWRCARLPKLEEAILYDQSGGLWELGLVEAPSDEYVAVQIEDAWESQNISDSIRHEAMVTIDFGTSNTVVAVSENEQVELLRLGLECSNALELMITCPTGLKLLS